MSAELDFGDAISWIIVVVGWLIINRQHNNRETRKEIRASLMDLYRLLDSIEADAFAYHTTEPDVALARKIKRELDQIYSRVRLALSDTVTCDSSKQISEFRKSITLHNFDTVSFEKKAADDSIFDEIMIAKRQLISVLEHAYSQKYR